MRHARDKAFVDNERQSNVRKPLVRIVDVWPWHIRCTLGHQPLCRYGYKNLENDNFTPMLCVEIGIRLKDLFGGEFR